MPPRSTNPITPAGTMARWQWPSMQTLRRMQCMSPHRGAARVRPPCLAEPFAATQPQYEPQIASWPHGSCRNVEQSPRHLVVIPQVPHRGTSEIDSRSADPIAPDRGALALPGETCARRSLRSSAVIHCFWGNVRHKPPLFRPRRYLRARDHQTQTSLPQSDKMHLQRSSPEWGVELSLIHI